MGVCVTDAKQHKKIALVSSAYGNSSNSDVCVLLSAKTLPPLPSSFSFSRCTAGADSAATSDIHVLLRAPHESSNGGREAERGECHARAHKYVLSPGEEPFPFDADVGEAPAVGDLILEETAVEDVA